MPISLVTFLFGDKKVTPIEESDKLKFAQFPSTFIFVNLPKYLAFFLVMCYDFKLREYGT